MRDENALESALARPKQKWSYEEDVDLTMLAAAYAFGIASNHPYLDGNKRVAFLATATFLGLNGFEIEATEPEVVEVMMALAVGQLTEQQMADWIREHLVRLSTS
jgi:death-on-curing protein